MFRRPLPNSSLFSCPRKRVGWVENPTNPQVVWNVGFINPSYAVAKCSFVSCISLYVNAAKWFCRCVLIEIYRIGRLKKTFRRPVTFAKRISVAPVKASASG